MAEFTWMLPMQSCNKRNRRKKKIKRKRIVKAKETKTEKAFILISFAILQIYDILITAGQQPGKQPSNFLATDPAKNTR